MFKKILALLLVLALTVSTLGCSGGSKNSAMKETLLAEGMLNEDTYILEAEGVQLKAHPVMNITEANASIYEVSNAPSLDEDGNQLKVYDFRVEGITQVEGVFELSIPLSVKEGEVPGAGYFNEETMEWEPVAFFYNPQAEVLTIYTDHLSKYGVFSYSGQGTRKAKMEFLGLYGDSEDVDFAAAVNEYSIAGVPGQDCYEIGVGAFSEAVGISSDILGNLGQAYGYAAYGTDVLDTIGDHLGSLGLVLSVVSIGNSIMNGNTHEAVVGAMKTSYTYVLGKVVGKLSNSVLSAGMAAVAIVDYSINKFGTEAIEGREDIYRDAYSIYYMRKEDGFKGSDYWYKTFYPLMANPTMSVDEIQGKIDEIVKAHCNEFWTGTNKLGVDYYVSEARERFAWTGGGAGLHQDMRDRISAERRAMLYQDVLPGVFHQIALKINMENEKLLRQEYSALSEYLNQSIGFTVIDPSKTYANHIVRFASLNENADVANWTGTFKKDGTLNTSFTLYGHIYAGSPNKLNIYGPDADPDQDPPLETLEFVVTPPNIEIVLKNEGGRLNSLVLQDMGDPMSGIYIEDEYKGTYVASAFPGPLYNLLLENPIPISKENTIDVTLTGGWAAPEMSGSSDAGEWSTSYQYAINSFTIQANLTENKELPVIGTKDVALILAGTGTYRYDITVTTIMRGKQTIPALGPLMTESTVDATKTTVTNFISTGDVEFYAGSKKLDESKDIIMREEGIENIKTTGVIMVMQNPVNQGESVTTHTSNTKWESGEEKDETSTYEENFDPNSQFYGPTSVYFKYPLKK